MKENDWHINKLVLFPFAKTGSFFLGLESETKMLGMKIFRLGRSSLSISNKEKRGNEIV